MIDYLLRPLLQICDPATYEGNWYVVWWRFRVILWRFCLHLVLIYLIILGPFALLGRCM